MYNEGLKALVRSDTLKAGKQPVWGNDNASIENYYELTPKL